MHDGGRTARKQETRINATSGRFGIQDPGLPPDRRRVRPPRREALPQGRERSETPNEADDVLNSPELLESLDKLSKEPHIRYVWLVSEELLYASGGPGRKGDNVTSMVPRPKLFGGQMDGRVGGPAAYGGLSRLMSGGAAEGYTRLAMARDRRPDISVSTWPVVVWVYHGRGIHRSMSPRIAILGVAYEGKRKPGDWNDTAVVRPELLLTESPERRHYGFRGTPPWYGRYSVTVKPLEGRAGDAFKATVGYTSKWFGSNRRRPPGTDELAVVVNDSRGTVVYTSPNDAGASMGRPYRSRRAGEKAPTSSTYSFILDKPGRYYVRAYGRSQPKTEPVLIEVF
ncbi:MAG: hypothetical protein HY876_01280 [Coriobacteriales bacterium]|nr:hypothetical protein [Coriobacteriales bacterium]